MKLLLLATWILLLFGCEDNQEKNLSGSADTSKQKFEWKMVTTWPKNYPGLGLGAENFAKKVEAMSAGRLKIKVFGAGQLFPHLRCLMLYHKEPRKWAMARLIMDGKVESSSIFYSNTFWSQCSRNE